jgi:hypothetical protein
MYDNLRAESGDDEPDGQPNELTVTSFSEMLLISRSYSNGDSGEHDGHVDMRHVNIVIKSGHPCYEERVVSGYIRRMHSIKAKLLLGAVMLVLVLMMVFVIMRLINGQFIFIQHPHDTNTTMLASLRNGTRANGTDITGYL